MSAPNDLPTFADVAAAAKRIAPHVLRTPVLASEDFNQLAGCEVWFKCENLQHGGAFKLRGASNAVWSLTGDDASHGVATHSSGNHGAALARAARARGIPAYVVVPQGAVKTKVRAIEALGGHLHWCEPTMEARAQVLAGVMAQTGAVLVHPYDDPRVIAGAGSAALELVEDRPGIDTLLAPIGGGGLISGTALVGKSRNSPLAVYGAEPAGANDAHLSFKAGERVTTVQPKTIADGLRAIVGVRNFALIRGLVDDILTVEEHEIVQAMRLCWEHLHVVIEPSSAVPLAALLKYRAVFAGRTVGVILSGGNVDLDELPWAAKQKKGSE